MHHQRADLDPFLGRGKGEFHLRLILTLVYLELVGCVLRTEVGGKIEFAATDDLADLWLYRPEDDEIDERNMRPVVRVNGQLVWDCQDGRDEDTSGRNRGRSLSSTPALTTEIVTGAA